MTSILDILPEPPTIDVVDIGANPIDGDPTYKPLLDAGIARESATLSGNAASPAALHTQQYPTPTTAVSAVRRAGPTSPMESR